MTASLAFCANTRVSLRDLPRTAPVADPQASLQTAVHRDFAPDTGSRYRLNRAKTLEFDSLAEVTADNLQHLRPRPVRNPQLTWPLRNDDVFGADAGEHGRPTSARSHVTSANAPIVADCIPIDRNDHGCC